MAESFHFSLVSPERQLLSEDVNEVIVPGADGEFSVLARHAPLMTTIQPGVVRVRGTTGGERRICVLGGFAEVSERGLTILAEQAIPVEELDPAVIDREIRDAEDDVADAADTVARSRAQLRLDRLKALRAAT